MSETFLSKYINDNLDREVPEFEAVALDIVRSIRDRMSFASSVYPTSVVRKMGKHSPPDPQDRRDFAVLIVTGNGKTSAVSHFAAENPSSICINLNATTREARLRAWSFAPPITGNGKGQTSRFDFLVNRFKGTGRLLIVDNAQRLTMSGRQWIFDFADEAECPVALVGNPEMIDAIRSNDQQFSRIGIHGNYELEACELHAAAMHVTKQVSDDATAEMIYDLTASIASRDGRLRSVKKP